ncbi:SRPBCC family protein [Nocardioides sp.]|uniref:SRPBCC family protein n=1 Tax=Nocardioides sp. TaxID=35761 RepID=UPI003518E39B
MTDAARPAERELRAETVVAAAPERVWAALTDFDALARWSPETVRMLPLLRGGLRVGQQYLGINRRGAVVWPTRSVVAQVEAPSVLVWDTRSSGARWIWELSATDDGRTRVVHRRPVPQRLTRVSGVFARVLLGGAAGHADELEAGMRTTVERLRAHVESA